MKKSLLFGVAAIIWGIPGAIITAKGILAYSMIPLNKLWWLLLITLFVLVGFKLMFSRIVGKYSELISAQPEKTTVWHTFPLRGWILIVFMTCLGIALKFIPGIPLEFTASFYSGLGPSLLYAAVLFILKRRSLR